MPLYTRTGDEGFSNLPQGPGKPPLAVAKNDPRLAALGSLDELSSMLGWCLTESRRVAHGLITSRLDAVQRDLFRIGAALASLWAAQQPAVKLELTAVEELERQIDAIFAPLPPLRNFLLPGGVELAARLHVARCVCRRAERAVVAALAAMAAPSATPRSSAKETCGFADDALPAMPPAWLDAAKLMLRYLNRLSDLLFALARWANSDAGQADAIWRP